MPIKLGITHSELAFMSVLHTGLQGKILPLLHHPSSARQHNKRGTHSMYFVQTAVQYYQNHFFLTTSQICPLEHLNFLPPRILTLKQPPPSRKKSNTIFVKEVLLSFSRADKLPSLRLSKTKIQFGSSQAGKVSVRRPRVGKNGEL